MVSSGPMSDVRGTLIPGVMRASTPTARDLRGSFTELWRASRWKHLTDATFVQANLSRSEAGVLRGMHFHRRQADLWILVEGRAFVAVCDLRGADDAPSTPAVDTFDMEPGDAVLIPSGVAHGFYARERMALVYLVTAEYDGSDELGFAWDDAGAGIQWPAGDPILSDRDASNPDLKSARAALRPA